MKHSLPLSQSLIRCHTVNTQTQFIKREKHLADGLNCLSFSVEMSDVIYKMQSLRDSKESCTENERNVSCFSGGKEMKNIRFEDHY